MTSENLVYLIALPLFSSALLMLLGRKADKWGHIFATLISASTFVIGAIEFFAMIDRPEASRAVTQKLFTWISVDTCLLYTSPSPRDRTRSRMPSSA